MTKYLKTDLYRMFTSRSLKIAICGVVFVFLIGWVEVWGSEDVFSILFGLKLYSILILMFAFGASAYANALVEDAEQKYWTLMVQRGKINSYVWSKILVCFFGSVFAITAGVMLFSLIARCNVPFLSETDNLARNEIDSDCFGIFINQRQIVLYLFFTAVRMGLLCGILSVFSMWLSLYVRNKMFAICIPVIGYYFWINYFGRIFGDISLFNINGIYMGSGNLFFHPVFNFLYAAGFALFFVCIIGIMIQSKVKKEIEK